MSTGMARLPELGAGHITQQAAGDGVEGIVFEIRELENGLEHEKGFALGSAGREDQPCATRSLAENRSVVAILTQTRSVPDILPVPT
jgi:hypothetical protein